MTLYFQNPWFLAGLLAITLPWLLKWYQTRNARTVLWGAMQFLEATLVREAARVRKQDRWQLLVRMAIVATTVLAIAKPVWAPKKLDSPILGQPYLLLLFDDSYSMQLHDAERLQFEVAQQQALHWMDEQHPETHYSVLTFSDVARLGEHIKSVAVYRNAEAAQEALRRLRPSYRADTFADILPIIQDLLRTRAEPVKQVCVFTDGQRHAWQNAKLNTVSPDTNLRLILPTKRPIDNLGITKLGVARKSYAVGESVRLTCDVANTGTVGHKQAWVKFAVEHLETGVSQTIASQHAEAKRSATQTFQQTHVFREPGLYAIQATLPPDDLLIDNQRHTLVEILPSFRVLLVGPHIFYLQTALAPKETGVVHTSTAPDIPTSLEPMRNDSGVVPVDGHAYSAVVVTRPWSVTEGRILGEYLNEGGVVWVCLGPEFQVEFEQDLPWLPVIIEGTKRSVRNIDSAQIEQSWELAPKPESQVLVADLDGNALAVKGDYGSGSCIVVGTTMGPPWSDWHIQPSFLPWIHETLRGIWSRAYRSYEWEVGISPSSVLPDSDIGLLEWPEEPGVYRLASDDPFVLNPPAEEADLDVLPLVWFWQHWPEVEAYISSSDQLSFVRQSYALWPWMWGIALFLACYEVWMSRVRPPEPD